MAHKTSKRVIGTPLNNRPLGEVTLVRLTRTGKCFEIVCYPNKVYAWRKNVETDINEVLQSKVVFRSVSKGQMASKEDLQNGFGQITIQEVCEKILKEGKVQTSADERRTYRETMLVEVSSIVTGMCVNPATNEPHTAEDIKRALENTQFQTDPNKNLNQLAHHAIHFLMSSHAIEIRRTFIKVRVTLPVGFDHTLMTTILCLLPVATFYWLDKIMEDFLELRFLIAPPNLNVLRVAVARERGHVDIID